MKRISIVFLLILALSLVAVQANGLELRAGASFNTIAMDYLNEVIATYNGRMGMSLPSLGSGLGLFGGLMLGLSPLDLGLGVERIAASSSAVDPHGIWESLDTSAFGFLGIGSWAVLRGGLEAHIHAALGWYSASYSNDLEAITAQGSAIGYKLGILLSLRLTGSLSLNATLGWRGLAVNELTDQRGHALSVHGQPYLDFSGLELGLGIGLSL